MHLSTSLSLFAVAGALSALVSGSPIQKRSTTFSPLRPPAFPLAVRNMYFSQWLAQDTLYGGWSQFWTGSSLGNAGLVRVDGTTYEFLGHPTQAAIGTTNQCSQTAASYTSTHSTFTMNCGPVTLKADFISPLHPNDIKRLSIPMSFVRIDVASNDGGTHSVQVYQDISGEWVHGNTSQIINWAFQTVSNLNVFTAQPANPTPLAEFNDHASWGQVIFATDNNVDPVTVQSGQDSVLRSQFVAHGALTNGQDTNYRAINNNWPVFAHARDFGSVTSSGKYALYVLGHVRDPAVNFIPGPKPSLWRDYFNSDWTQMLTFFWNDYATANDLDATVATAASAQGGQNYVAITSLAVRQAFGGTEFVGTQSKPFLMLKEISSDGNVQTVDVLYPAFPIFYFLNPELLRYLLDPIFDNVESGYWPKAFAIHDIGSSYPQATGHQNGNEEDMPIEESANMLIMATAYCQAANNFSYCNQHYTTLHGWADYLVANLPDAENQQQTDDFTGPIAHSVNLALKGIIGIGAQGIIAAGVGNSADKTYYSGKATSYINTWALDSQDPSGKHLKLAYDQNGTWSLAYNAFSDVLLGTGLVSSAIINEQDAFYQTVATAPYGIKLDSRTNNWSKCDWEIFTAAASKSSQVKQHFIDTLAAWLAATGDRVPFGDLYDTVSGSNDGFRARPVVGGTFAIIAAAGKNSTTTPPPVGITSGSSYNVQVSGGRSGCNTYLSTVACGNASTPNLVNLFGSDDGSGRQRWQFNAVSGKTNTYNIESVGRSGCNKYLSAIACGGTTPNLVDLYSVDDNSGRQQWLLNPVAGKTLTFDVENVGRGGCNNFLSSASCGSDLVDLFNTDDASGRQQWALTAV